ncbi:MAG: Sir2 family NAD-dependent protein deacetylase [Anaerolineales bacterium]
MESPLPEVEERIQQAAQIMRTRDHGVALTGAGISTPSGIPDFRSTGSGLWTRYQPMEVASLTAFRYHPEKFYQWLRPLANQMFSAEPNEAHLALAQLEENHRISTVITQNIDTLHQKAGSENILEVHGTLETLSCIACFRQVRATEDIISSLIEEGKVPRCPDCGAVLKPDVVLFEEQLPAKIWRKAKICSQKCSFMLILGSSLTVTPVSSLPLEALASGALLIIINQSETYLDERADVVIHDDVANILPAITQKVLYG